MVSVQPVLSPTSDPECVNVRGSFAVKLSFAHFMFLGLPLTITPRSNSNAKTPPEFAEQRQSCILSPYIILILVFSLVTIFKISIAKHFLKIDFRKRNIFPYLNKLIQFLRKVVFKNLKIFFQCFHEKLIIFKEFLENKFR